MLTLIFVRIKKKPIPIILRCSVVSWPKSSSSGDKAYFASFIDNPGPQFCNINQSSSCTFSAN